MRFPDLVIMSISNLKRRKLRTVLTVLGVIIGTASIVVMVSLGTGLGQIFMKQISSRESLTTISVYSDSFYGGAVTAGGDGSSKSSGPTYTADDVMARLGRLPYVSGVSPILEINVAMRQGVYKAQYLFPMGASQSFLEQIPLGEGKLPEPGEMGMAVGNTIQQNFYNSRTDHGCWDTGEMPDADFMSKPLFMIFDVDAHFQTRSGPVGSQKGGQTPVKPSKKYMLNATEMVGGDPDDWDSYSYNVYTDTDDLRTQLRKVFKRGTVIPGRPTNKERKPLNYLTYNRVRIFVDNMEYVQEVQKQIVDMRFQVSGQTGQMENTKQQSSMTQAVLGGIGAVSLFVAAISITDTMMMSICKRTKEIGVMKALGCNTRSIRNMFLIESDFIGSMGGVTGILLNYSISVVINQSVNLEEMNDLTGSLPGISPWPSVAAMVFAIFVDMAAGFMPAVRAMKLSPLAAVRNEQGEYASIGDCSPEHS